MRFKLQRSDDPKQPYYYFEILGNDAGSLPDSRAGTRGERCGTPYGGLSPPCSRPLTADRGHRRRAC